jgi:hypothetical protein
MADVVLKQERLNKDKPAGWTPKWVIRRMLTYLTDPGNPRRLIFQLNRDGPDNTEGSGAALLDLDVRDNTEFFLSLDPAKDWFWSVEFDAITTKAKHDRFYGDILYERDGAFEERIDGKGWRTKKICFYALHNKNGPLGTRHSFSMNIDLILTDALHLPITLDPDIKNPPPGDGPAPIVLAPGLLSAG